MADKDFKVKSGLDLGTPLPLTEGGTGQTSAANALNALLPLQTSASGKVLSTDGTSTSWVTLPNGYQKGDTASRPGSPALGDIYSNTQTGYIEVYTAAGWSQLGVIPLSATIGSPTDVGTNVSYGSGSVDVAFTPASGGGLASSFTAVSSPGSISASGSSSPVRVTGLTQGTAYTFTVTATNGYGNALASSSSSSVTPTSVPQAPTIGSPTVVNGTAYGSPASITLGFTANATGGKSITNYKFSTDGTNYTALSPAATTSPLTIPGLTGGTSYTVRLKAVNNNGDSSASSASSSITAVTAPDVPTSVSASNVGTSRSYNNGAAIVSFSAPVNNGGASITSYTVTSSPGGYTASGASSPLTVTGLQSNTSYTFSVTATNSAGTSSSSSASSSITATTVPQAPTIGSVTRTNDTTVSIPFTAGGTGGSAITSYTITSSPSISLTYSGTSSPFTVTGSFVSGTAYTFTMTATNANGTSTSSSASNSIIPFPSYTLSQTFNTSGTYTIPANINQIALVAYGAGGGGGGGWGSNSPDDTVSGGRGGGGGGVFAIQDYSVTPGSNYTVTIGSAGNAGAGGTAGVAHASGGAGGATSFGNLVTVNGGGGGFNSGGTAGSASSNIGGSSASGGAGGVGGEGNTPNGNAGGNGGNVTLTATGASGTYQSGGGGGGGGLGAFLPNVYPSAGNGSAGGNRGGAGGAGGYSSAGSIGTSGTAPGGGGGGGGGASYVTTNSSKYNGGTGGSGSTARILVYVR